MAHEISVAMRQAMIDNKTKMHNKVRYFVPNDFTCESHFVRVHWLIHTSLGSQHKNSFGPLHNLIEYP